MESSDWELGMVIECHEWLERMEIRYQRSDLRVGMGSNKGQVFIPAISLIVGLYFVFQVQIGLFRSISYIPPVSIHLSLQISSSEVQDRLNLFKVYCQNVVCHPH